MNRVWAACAVAGLIAFASALAGIDVRATYGARVSGDEPQYLITAVSLGEDGDLDVSDEIAEGRWRSFHEVSLNQQTRRLASGREVSPHDPLLPALLAVPMLIGGWWAAKATLAVLSGALAALLVWIAVRRFGVGVFPATLTVGIYGASAPIAVYGSQVYPELPAALVVAAAVALLTGPLRRPAVVAAGLSVVGLPWLSVKYAPVAAAIAGVLIVRLWRMDRRRAAGMLLTGFGLAGVAFAAAHWAWYGGWTAYATGDHFVDGEFGVVGFAPDFAGRSRRLVGLLVDRNFGIAAWQPAWLLAVPATVAVVRARPHFWVPLVALAAAGWLNATFVALTMHGWWWPGRQIVVVAPVLILAVAWWVDSVRPARIWLATSGAIGVATYVWLVVEGSLGHITWIVDFFETTNPVYRAWRAVMPDYMNMNAWAWTWHGAWIAACAGLAAWGWASARRSAPTGVMSQDRNIEPLVPAE